MKPIPKYGQDLVRTRKRAEADPVIGRDEEIRNVNPDPFPVKTKNNPVLIGEPGVGKRQS